LQACAWRIANFLSILEFAMHGTPLAAAQPLTCSWVVNSAWEHHQRLELENDLIAAWVIATGSPPAAQFYALRRSIRLQPC
jgi:hypothetical protein